MSDARERQRVLDSLFTSRELKKMQLLDKKERNQNNEENPNLDEETKRKILSRYESMMYDDDEIDEDYVASVYNPNEDIIEGETEVPGVDTEQIPASQEKSEERGKRKEKEKNEQKNDRKDGQKNGQKNEQNREKKGDGKKEQKGNQKKGDEKKAGNAKRNNTKESGKSQNGGENNSTNPKTAEGAKENKGNKENKENKENKTMKNGIKEKRYEKSIQRNKLNHHRKERDDKKRGYY